MKKFFGLTVIGLFFCVGCLRAQINSPQQLAQKQAQRLKDSIGIDEIKMRQLYNINVNINYALINKRKAYTTQPSTYQNYIQQQELYRDSCYQTILSSAEFNLYKLKKNTLFVID